MHETEVILHALASHNLENKKKKKVALLWLALAKSGWLKVIYCWQRPACSVAVQCVVVLVLALLCNQDERLTGC